MSPKRLARGSFFCLLSVASLVCLVDLFRQTGSAEEARTADSHEAAGLAASIGAHAPSGGWPLAVHLSGDKHGTASLALAEKARRVHVVVRSTEVAQSLRGELMAEAVHGRVTVGLIEAGRLPYADHLANAVLVSDWCGVAVDEVQRVLAPTGQLLLTSQPTTAVGRALSEAGFVRGPDGQDLVVYQKAWPEDLDHWTHFLHGPSGNAVSRDTRIGPPSRLRWTAGPRYGRHHNRIPTVSAMISARGLLFYILDDAPPGARNMPPRFGLFARDAFNGVLLWRRPIEPWGWRAWTDDPLPEYGFGGRRSVGGRFTQPLQLPRTLVAGEEHVYITLGYGAPVSQLDMRSGTVLQTYHDTAGTDEILFCPASVSGKAALVLAVHEQPIGEKVDKQRSGKEVDLGKRVVAVDPSSGQLLWQSEPLLGVSGKMGFMDIHRNLNPAVEDNRVVVTAKDSIVCLDLQSGEVRWRVPRPMVPEQKTRYDLRSTDMVTLVCNGTLVLFAQLEPDRRLDWRQTSAMLYAYRADDGELLWKQPCGSWGWGTPPDVWVIDGRIWVAGQNGERFLGIDPARGRIEQEIDCKQAFAQEHHHRCYRNKATPRYLITSFHGMDVFDLGGEKPASVHPWVRSVCRYGFMPANGLIYNAPDHCGCYPHVKLTGFNALASGKSRSREKHDKQPDRLQTGPAWTSHDTGKQDRREKTTQSTSGDWPAFRHDSRRTGIASCKVPSEMKRLWTTSLGEVPTQATAAQGRVFVAVPEQCAVVCLDAATGRRLWAQAVGSRVDTPPSCYRGTVIFGCADGNVYCLRAADGELVWRFRAAPRTRLIACDGRLESAWPVHGSVIVENSKVYVVAGRSSYLDGGFDKWVLDAATGRVISRGRIDAGVEFLGMRLGTQSMTGVKAYLLTSDGPASFMRHEPVFRDIFDGPARPRLQTIAGFLDGSLFNRTSQWKRGQRLLGDYSVADENEAYCWRLYDKRTSGDHGFFQPGSGDGELCGYRSDKSARVTATKEADKGRKKDLPAWKRPCPIVVRGMVKAGGTLFICGPPDVTPQKDPWRSYEGRAPGVLLVIAADSGEDMARHELASPAVYHGMSAAGGRLFVACRNGDVVCFGGG